MANVNKVMLIGRLTRDPEFRTFANGGKVAKFGFAVTNRRKNSQTGEWEDEPMFIDCEVYNRGEAGKQADLFERFGLHKGSQIFIEGRLHLDTWDDKNGGGKRQKHKLVVDNFQLLDPRQDGSEGMARPAPVRSAAAPAARSNGPARSTAPSYDEYESGPSAGDSGGDPSEIPF